LNEDIVRAISMRRGTTMDDWLAYRVFSCWQEMTEPEWANVHYAKPDFQAISIIQHQKR
jgi:Fe-S cluster assembly protein SufB